ncbi:DUF1295 domain-containing protein [Streptomyces sp. NPDC058796]|uniref:DUF1295 domain-containing protein n=1 Tax=unclassified Streptomyces TaxID=2593676 RepID=UPI0036AB9C72
MQHQHGRARPRRPAPYDQRPRRRLVVRAHVFPLVVPGGRHRPPAIIPDPLPCGGRTATARGRLWSWTRRPYCFGDFLVWRCLFLAACDAGLPAAAVSVLSSLVITYLLLGGSGKRLLERHTTDRPGRPAPGNGAGRLRTVGAPRPSRRAGVSPGNPMPHGPRMGREAPTVSGGAAPAWRVTSRLRSGPGATRVRMPTAAVEVPWCSPVGEPLGPQPPPFWPRRPWA